MKRPFVIAAVALALAGSAAAQPPPGASDAAVTDICLDVGGQSLPAVCQVPDSRVDRREDICVCPRGRRVVTPVCPPGVRPPAETRAYERARRLAAEDGSLVGDLYEGAPMCVRARSGG